MRPQQPNNSSISDHRNLSRLPLLGGHSVFCMDDITWSSQHLGHTCYYQSWFRNEETVTAPSLNASSIYLGSSSLYLSSTSLAVTGGFPLVLISGVDPEPFVPKTSPLERTG
jgi:hypothetical protein